LGWAEKHDVVALDYSHSLLLENPVSARVEASVYELPFPDESFDLVFSGAMLHHITDVSRALREMRRVSRKYVAAIEPNRNNPAMAVFGLINREERGLLPFTAKWLRHQATTASLSVQICKPFGWILPNKLPEFLVPIVDRLPREHPLSFDLLLVAEK
jgi:ubiquinone/menaquinone biosynthesis C-methylase UbiE